jgi:hypothetical protein
VADDTADRAFKSSNFVAHLHSHQTRRRSNTQDAYLHGCGRLVHTKVASVSIVQRNEGFWIVATFGGALLSAGLRFRAKTQAIVKESPRRTAIVTETATLGVATQRLSVKLDE